jgi:hypothetical protein
MKEKHGECRVPGCGRAHYSRGYCKRHYTQVSRHGRTTPERERGKARLCNAPGCTRADCSGDYCRKHARQIKVHGRLTPEREHQRHPPICSYPGCKNPHRAKGLCKKHYAREHRLKS